MIEQALVALLNTITGVTALTSNRISDLASYSSVAYPYIVLEVTEQGSLKSLAGSDTLTKAYASVNIYGSNDADPKTVANAIFAFLKTGQRRTVSGVPIQWIWYENEHSDFLNPAQANEKGIYRTIVDLLVWYER